jgi:OmcA/MtrC family decaheme c-type cytochrome
MVDIAEPGFSLHNQLLWIPLRYVTARAGGAYPDRDTEQPDPVIEFRLRDDNDEAVINLPPSGISCTFAKLIPATDGNTRVWQSYLNRLDNGAVQATTENGASGTLVDHGDGTYTYAFATDLTKVTNPLAVSYNARLTHRVSFEIRGFVPVDNPVYDFRPEDGATSGLFTRESVKTATCNRCHEKLALHGSARFEVRQCVACHNPGSTDGGTGNTVDFKDMIHKIHAAATCSRNTIPVTGHSTESRRTPCPTCFRSVPIRRITATTFSS